MTQIRIERLVEAAARTIVDHAAELTTLDQAIGDGDHGSNMKRGMEAVLADLPNQSGKPPGDLLKAVGLQLVMKVGGASGPLYGTLTMELGKALPQDAGRAELVGALDAAIAGVKARGKAELGQKTLIDVLVPVRDAVAGGKAPDAVAVVAQTAAAATVPLRATRGRASFLGDRSIGHIDPGARSCALMIEAICAAMGH